MDRDLVIGLDLGEVSVGWAVIDNKNKEIVDIGVRCWDKSQDRSGKLLSAQRREYRGRRRTTRRKAHRKQRLKNTIIKYGLMSKEEMAKLFESPGDIDVYTLRLHGLDRLLTNEELTRILVKLAKNRGFKSNRKADKESEGILNDAISENEKLMDEKGYRTVGEMFAIDPKFSERKRNTEGSYITTVSRKLVIDELREILKIQKDLGNKNITDEFIKEIIGIVENQRHFASGDQIMKMVGDCTFETGFKRAPKATYSFSKFQVLQELNNLRLLDENRNKKELDLKQKKLVFEKIFSSSGKFTYGQIRKTLKLDDKLLFTKLNYDKDIKEVEKDVFINIEEFIKISKALKSFNLSNEELDNICMTLSYYKTDEDIEKKLNELGFSEEVIAEVQNINIKSTKPCHLSFEALRKINIGLEKGLTYNEACILAGYDPKAQGKEEDKTELLPNIPKDEITNPVVYKALIEARNVVNSIIEKYGSPIGINIELTRELAKSEKAKKAIAKAQKEIKTIKDSILSDIKKDRPDINISGTQILKLRLWREQGERCIYSNKPIDIDDVLFDETACQVDHILPYSRSFDDSYNNKVLVLTKENQDKKDKTPFEAFGHTSKWDMFVANVSNNKNIPYKKKLNLLNCNFENEEKQFLERNLRNTSYITDFFSKFIRNNLRFAPSENKVKVNCINGVVTSNIRYLLGLEKDRSIDTHHAVDAAIVAVTGNSFIQQITKYYKDREYNRTLSKREGLKFPRPWENFEYEVENKVNDIFVSRAEKRKITGSAQDDTLYAYKGKGPDGYHIIGKNVDITKLSIDKNGELTAGKLGKVDSNNPLYKVIYEAIKGGKDLNNLKTPSKNGNGNPIRKIMVTRSAGSGNITILNNGKSAKLGGDIIRTDIFEKEGKFYFVPMYVSDTVKKELPNKAIKKTTPRDKWIDIDNSFNFKFSIYKNTVLKIKKKEGKEYIGYVSSNPDVSEARFEMKYNNGEDIGRVTFGTLLDIEKYTVDNLGNLTKVDMEERRTFR